VVFALVSGLLALELLSLGRLALGRLVLGLQLSYLIVFC